MDIDGTLLLLSRWGKNLCSNKLLRSKEEKGNPHPLLAGLVPSTSPGDFPVPNGVAEPPGCEVALGLGVARSNNESAGCPATVGFQINSSIQF